MSFKKVTGIIKHPEEILGPKAFSIKKFTRADGCYYGNDLYEIAGKERISVVDSYRYNCYKINDSGRLIPKDWLRDIQIEYNWNTVNEKSKTEDVQVLVWDTNKFKKVKRYLSHIEDLGRKAPTFYCFESGATRWSGTRTEAWPNCVIAE